MFNNQSDKQGSATDLNTAARIRDAAIELFAAAGFRVGVRAIAAAAGVSPGLVNHHFGSKDGLRIACDERVLQLIRDERTKAATATDATSGLLAAMADVEEYGPLIGYMVRSLITGGQLAESLLEHMISDATDYLEQGVALGTIKPSRDPAARARHLTLLNVGASMLYLQLRLQRGEDVDYRAAIRDLTETLAFPAVELYSQGLFTDPTVVDTFQKER
ncbi:TetR/AcrR family transcriptional regulator [Nocardia callitridis]|uniref:Transcriptional regulator RaaS n=1 Tax=Nocardia callitridis TaxID=648753 RepID=A0ABP9K561_9NOCA